MVDASSLKITGCPGSEGATANTGLHQAHTHTHIHNTHINTHVNNTHINSHISTHTTVALHGLGRHTNYNQGAEGPLLLYQARWVDSGDVLLEGSCQKAAGRGQNEAA